MSKLRPEQIRGPAKKLTREALRANPQLSAMIRSRIKEQSEVRAAKKAGMLDVGTEELEP